MKNIFTSLLFTLIVSFSFGQSMKFVCQGDTIENNQTITYQIPDINAENDFSIGIVSLYEADTLLRFKKEEISVLAGSSNNFCGMGECYTGAISYSFTLNSSSSSIYPEDPNGFVAKYNPNGLAGTSTIKYTYLTVDSDNNPTGDEISVTVVYSTEASGVANTTPAQTFSLNSYPNPAVSDVTIQYNLGQYTVSNAKLMIKNLVGATMYSVPLTQQSDKVKVNISDFASGIYFYSIEANGKILATKKLLVK